MKIKKTLGYLVMSSFLGLAKITEGSIPLDVNPDYREIKLGHKFIGNTYSRFNLTLLRNYNKGLFIIGKEKSKGCGFNIIISYNPEKDLLKSFSREFLESVDKNADGFISSEESVKSLKEKIIEEYKNFRERICLEYNNVTNINKHKP